MKGQQVAGTSNNSTAAYQKTAEFEKCDFDAYTGFGRGREQGFCHDDYDSRATNLFRYIGDRFYCSASGAMDAT